MVWYGTVNVDLYSAIITEVMQPTTRCRTAIHTLANHTHAKLFNVLHGTAL